MKIGTVHMTHWERGRTQRQVLDETVDRMVRAEQLGYYASWLTEHHFANDHDYDPLGFPAEEFPAYDIAPDPLTFLNYVASRTTRLRLGTAVIVLNYDDPIRVAERAAMVDVMSGGRLELGVGRGSGRREPAAFHVPQERNRERFKEMLDIINLAWTGEPFTYDGEFFHIPEVAVVPKPIQQPGPPLYVAAGSAETFPLVGSYGLPYCYTGGAWGPVPRAAYRDNHRRFEEAARAAGHDPNALLFPHVLLTYCGETDAEAEAVASEYIPRFMAMVEAHYERLRFPDHDRARPGNLQSADQAESLTRQMVELNIIGSPETCIQKLEAYLPLTNLNYLLAFVDFGAIPHDLVMKSMERFAEQVMPHFVQAPVLMNS